MTGCNEASFLLFANAWGVGTLLTAKCPPLGTHLVSNARGLVGGGGGGMLAAGIDSHISDEENKRQPKKTQLPSAQVTSAV